MHQNKLRKQEDALVEQMLTSPDWAGVTWMTWLNWMICVTWLIMVIWVTGDRADRPDQATESFYCLPLKKRLLTYLLINL